MLADRYNSETVVIPVRLTKGHMEFLYGGSMPKLKDDTPADLVVPKYALEDPGANHLLTENHEVTILKQGSRLYVGLNPDICTPALVRRYGKQGLPGDFEAYAGIELKDDLKLQIRGTKRASLCQCQCQVPALKAPSRDETGTTLLARSLNHAYTLLSEEFETTRSSHTGNVFQRIFYRATNSSDREAWHPLEFLRSREEREFESRLQEWAEASS